MGTAYCKVETVQTQVKVQPGSLPPYLDHRRLWAKLPQGLASSTTKDIISDVSCILAPVTRSLVFLAAEVISHQLKKGFIFIMPYFAVSAARERGDHCQLEDEAGKGKYPR